MMRSKAPDVIEMQKPRLAIKARRRRAHLRGSARDIAAIVASSAARAAQSGSNTRNLRLGCLPIGEFCFLARVIPCNCTQKRQTAVFDAKN